MHANTGLLESRQNSNDNNTDNDCDNIQTDGGKGNNDSPSSSMTSTLASQQSLDDDYLGPGSANAMSMKNPGVTISEERSAEATLASYASFAVEDNYLYDDDDEDQMSPGLLRNDPSLWMGEDPTLEEENAELDKQTVDS